MAHQPRFLQDASPAHVALKIFGIAVAIGLLILALLYIIYASSNRGSGVKFINPRRRARDPETGGGDAASCSGNTHHAHSVDTLPRYEEAGSEALPPGGSEHGRTGGGEGGKPPPYTLDAGGAVDAEIGDGNSDSQADGRAGGTTSPAPVHLQSS